MDAYRAATVAYHKAVMDGAEAAEVERLYAVIHQVVTAMDIEAARPKGTVELDGYWANGGEWFRRPCSCGLQAYRMEGGAS